EDPVEPGDLRFRHQRDYRDDAREAREVRRIVREELPNSEGLHRSYDVRIVNLLAANGDLCHQTQKILGHKSAVFCEMKPTLEVANVGENRGHRLRAGKCLRTRDRNQILAKYLPTNPELGTGVVSVFEPS